MPSDWGGGRHYRNVVPFNHLHRLDQEAYKEARKKYLLRMPTSTTVVQGTLKQFDRGAFAFLSFVGCDGRRMGAWWNASTHVLKIAPLPRNKTLWDYASDAAREIGELAGDVYGFVKDEADDVYNAVKEYGCALVNNELLVVVVAGGASLIATPATGAAIVGGAATGKGACAVLEVGEALVQLWKILSTDWDPPPPAPPTTSTAVPSAIRVYGKLSSFKMLTPRGFPAQPPRPLPPLVAAPLSRQRVQAYDSPSSRWFVVDF
jgi:hypothetical protein